jgi:pimeloyl-ACP methyl ester carboxylesterase
MQTGATDSTVVSSGVPIAVRDFGGDGPGVILVHGLARTLLDWTVVAACLTRRHRVVAMDVRGHGESGDGPWSWTAALDDIAAVADHCGISSPAVVGHSLGGMIAAMWAGRHPQCPGAVNLDGHGRPHSDQYVGLDPSWVAKRRAEAAALQVKTLAALSGPLSSSQVEALMAQQRSLAAQLGASQDLFVAALDRSLGVRDGRRYLRPAPDGLGAAIWRSVEETDMLALYRRVRCPLLVVNGTRREVNYGDAAAGLSWVADLGAAFRAGVTRDLRALAAEQPNLRFETIDGSHGLLFEQPQAVARLVADFLAP